MEFWETIEQAIVKMDNTILNMTQEYLRCGVLDTVMPWITALGNAGIFWIVISVVLLCIKRYRRYGVMMLCALAVTTLLGEITIKNIVERMRPFHAHAPFDLLISPPKGYSFPSGHSAASFSAATVLCFLDKKAGIAGLALAALIGFSRIYLYVHYPSDVLAGIFLGTAVGLLTVVFFRKLIWKQDLKR